MSVYTSAGTKFSVSAAAPAAYTQAGYEALAFTEVGEVSDLGDLPERVYEVVSWRNIANRGETKAKGGYTLGSQTITVGIDPDDAGQDLLDTLSRSDDPASIAFEHPSLGTIYGRALVMGGARSYGDVNTIATRQVTLEWTIVSQDNDGIVHAPAG
ncbi:hypothetical protein [Novosphingobium sp. HII-3]|uniref:hypothetical protein n=1 Tax=Novosphingobium sp. HII-3 TaxID=2075565 RepID=UPI000CDB6F02|nr:hypothetical protein [Novosphingobium sp. HII-3]